MSIPIEFMNIIIPVEVIEAKYLGGWAQCQIDLQVNEVGSPRWSDGELFRDGAMNHWDMNAIIGFWEELGLVGEFGRGSTRRWKDYCLDATLSSEKIKCAWLRFDEKEGQVSYVPPPPVRSRQKSLW